MKIGTVLRKSISIILCIAMLASLIVAGTFSAKAEAVAGTYSFRVKWRCTNGGNSYKTGYSYDGDRADNGKNYVGFTVFYKDTNGTGEELHVDKDLGGSMKDKNDGQWVEWTNTGFPSGIFSHNDHGNAIASGELKILELQVKKNGAADSAYTTLWSGTLRTKSNINIMEAWYYSDGTKGTSGGDAEASGSAWTSKYPKPAAVNFTTVPSNTTVTAPKMGETNKSLQYEATVYDQYGVTWYQPPSYSLATAFEGVSIAATTGLVTVTSDAHSADGTDTTITIDAVSKSNKGQSSIKIINAKYNYEFKDVNGNTIPGATGTIKYGSVIPSPATPTKPYEDSVHYNFTNWTANDPNWASSGNRIHMDTILTPEFESESHAYLHYYPDNNATCTHDGTKTATCSCGKTDTVTDVGSILPHTYDEEITLQPTCETDGVLTYTCSKCGASYTEPIVHTGHNYEYKTVQPTCTEDGFTGYVCEYCGDSYGCIPIESPGHDWDEGTVVTAATCTTDGESLYTCQACQKTEKRTVKALGHNVKNWVLDNEPTCTEPGLQSGICKTCHDYIEEEIPALGHDYGDGTWIEDYQPTCDTVGRKHQICTRCGFENVNNPPALGHEYELITVDPKTEYGEAVTGCYYYHCSVCKKYATCIVHEDGTKEAGETSTSKTEVISQTATIPTPEFNTYNRVQSNYNYSKRGASLKIDSSNGADVQAMRFCASMLLPEGATVIDYGFVHTIAFTTMKKFVIGGDHVTQVSLLNGNHSTFATDEGTVYTFNLVINVNSSNWDTIYNARPYIKYSYAGETFTVYDDVRSERSVKGIAEQVVASPFESDSVKDFFNAKIFGK